MYKISIENFKLIISTTLAVPMLSELLFEKQTSKSARVIIFGASIMQQEADDVFDARTRRA